MEVTLIDVMGSDLTCVNSARVSFDKESFWEINPDEETGVSLKEKDQKLISYLAKHNHWTPFSHVQITMREKVPIFVARQKFKSVVGFSYNEVSRRYVDDTPEFYTPQVWRSKAENKKQGSSDTEVENSLGVNIGYVELVEQVIAQYEWMLTQGVAPELAKMILPQSVYTSYYVTESLAAWARAYKLRSDPHAQKEIQDLSKMWNDTISNLPELKYSWKALTE